MHLYHLEEENQYVPIKTKYPVRLIAKEDQIPNIQQRFIAKRKISIRTCFALRTANKRASIWTSSGIT